MSLYMMTSLCVISRWCHHNQVAARTTRNTRDELSKSNLLQPDSISVRWFWLSQTSPLLRPITGSTKLSNGWSLISTWVLILTWKSVVDFFWQINVQAWHDLDYCSFSTSPETPWSDIHTSKICFSDVLCLYHNFLLFIFLPELFTVW